MGVLFGSGKPLTGLPGGRKNTWGSITGSLSCYNKFPKIAGVEQHWKKDPESANLLSCSLWLT